MDTTALRQKLLDLAICGRLVPQNPDEPAIELDAEDTVPEPEQPFEIPENWRWVKLQNLFKFVDYRGKTPKKSPSGIRLMTASNIKQGYIDHTRMEYISQEEYLSRQSRGISQKGDILFTTEAPLGNAALADLDVYSAGQRVITLQSDNVEKSLFVYFLISPFFQKTLKENATGSTAQGIKAANLKKLCLPVPPLPEQKRIAAKLEQLFEVINRCEEAQKQIADTATQLRSSLLQAAIQGRLVPQNPDEPAVELDAKDIVPESEQPYEIPENWRWVKLFQCISVNPKVESLDDETSVSFLPMANVEGGYRSKYITEIRNWKEVKRGFTRFTNGDVIVARITPCFQNMKSAVCQNLTNGVGTGSTEFHVLRCKEHVFNKYLLYFVKTPFMLQYGVSRFSGAVGQQRFSSKEIKIMPFPLPPLTEQKRIVTKLELLFSTIDLIPTHKYI